jgi:hypothetical protein
MTLLAGESPEHVGLPATLGRFVLAGTFAGYIETSFGVDSGRRTLIVVDVASKEKVQDIAAGSYVDAGIISSEDVSEFVINRHGSVAWITERKEREQPEERLTVKVAGPSGAVKVLDASSAIAPRSLRLSDHKLSWSDGGVRHTARMP